MQPIQLDNLDNEDSKIIELASEVAKELNTSDKYPPHLNLLASILKIPEDLNEDGHTDILADMLKIEDVQRSFVNYFFKDVGLEWTTYFEVYTRIKYDDSIPDILLNNDNSLIIIENKITGKAGEQPQQMYRYVVDIGEKRFGKECKENIKKKCKGNIYVLYLKGNDRVAPTQSSTTGGNPERDVRQEMGNRFLVRNYSEDIVGWIDCYLQKLNHIISALLQYKDFLTYYIYKNNPDLKKEVSMIIEKINSFRNKQNSINMDNIQEYNNNIKNLNELKGKIDVVIKKMYEETKQKIISEWKREWKDKWKDEWKDELEISFLMQDKQAEGVGLSFNFDGQKLTFNSDGQKFNKLELSNKQNLYLGLFVDFNTKEATNANHEIHPWVGLYSADPNNFGDLCKELEGKLEEKPEGKLDRNKKNDVKKICYDNVNNQNNPLWQNVTIQEGPEVFKKWYESLQEIFKEQGSVS